MVARMTVISTCANMYQRCKYSTIKRKRVETDIGERKQNVLLKLYMHFLK